MKKTSTPEKATTKGYKVTDADMKCQGFKFELNKKFTHNGKVEMCNSGFHYCPIAADCFSYKSFDSTNRVFEIIDHGETIIGNDKNVTACIELTRELTWIEVLSVVNFGKDNTGFKNTGNWNTGDSNTGYRNTGNWNTGNRNTGDRNTGNWNTGDRNTGDSNTGYWNTGYRNTGNWNTGNWNTGDRNTGDSNTGYRNGGAFCTDNNPKLILFDVQTDILVKDWENHKACILMNNLNPNIWIWESEMSETEKTKFPSYKTSGGFLKSIPMHEAWTNFWGNLSDNDKHIFTSLPHFSKEKFKEITGIDV